ncbi:diphthine--ammonia ligase [Halobacillus sp. K22]|uniref:Dph6-related ATP pyrophosphatase n=1 Tax=Halobacillus sp. K22 TaxID=3457431 RepID=UPI003FCE6233
MKNVIVSWSGGKDSSLALFKLLNDPNVKVKGLFSTVSSESDRLPMHEVKRTWLARQAEAIGLPHYELELPSQASNEIYEQELQKLFEEFKKQGIYTVVYADLFLEDIRTYRDEMLDRLGMEGYYPLWKADSRIIANEFINSGFMAIVTTVDTDQLSPDFMGEEYSNDFLNRLPSSVDPCGEHGEFHTFVFDGPIFRQPISVITGKSFSTMNKRFVHIELKRSSN